MGQTIESKALRYFHEVAECQSFTLASERLHVAQPAVSMAIRKLEASLGVSLFHRVDRQISLTDEGRCLLGHAKKLLQQLADAELEMEELRGLSRGEVRLGVPGMVGSYYIPPLLMAFRHQHPGLKLSVVDAGADLLQQMLIEGELDLGFIVADDVPNVLESDLFVREQIFAAVAKDHRFANAESVTMEDFLTEELAMFKPGYFHRRTIDQMAKTTGITPNIGIETNLVPLLRAVVRQGFGVTVFLECVLKDDPHLARVPFAKPLWLDIHLAWRKGGYLSVANRAFKDFTLANR